MSAVVEFDAKSEEQSSGIYNESFSKLDDSSLSCDGSQADNMQTTNDISSPEEKDVKAKEPVKVIPIIELVREFVNIIQRFKLSPYN